MCAIPILFAEVGDRLAIVAQRQAHDQIIDLSKAQGIEIEVVAIAAAGGAAAAGQGDAAVAELHVFAVAMAVGDGSLGAAKAEVEIGRASCRERVCKYV